MTINANRILTTHVGSLPRPKDLIAMLYARERGEAYDEAAMANRVTSAVTDVVAHQREVGVDVVNDGEASKLIYSTYVQYRLTGFGGNERRPWNTSKLAQEFPDLWAKMSSESSGSVPKFPICNGPVAYRPEGLDALNTDLTNLKQAVQALGDGNAPAGVFVSSASPGIISGYMQNRHYETEEDYIWAIARAMKTEYDAIAQAGFIVQVDCPDLTGFEYPYGAENPNGFADYRASIAMRIEALNHALSDVPAEQARMHVCWGNSAGPHNYDVEFKRIVDLVLQAKPAGISFEGANPRHEHEWKLWQTVTLPEGKYLIPGVIDSTTNFVEHPDLVAERILRYASVVGPERVMAGVDCGLATAAGSTLVDRDVAWVKLGSLAEGARLANAQLKLPVA
jgi:5-methyltetrahydropteroyltriglutamate--homocysteine methyltransferase